jgi:hypothetical protein
MGFALHGFCHSTITQASTQACANQYPVAGVVSGSLGTSVAAVISCEGVATDGALQLQKRHDGALVSSFTQAMAYPPCDWADFPSNPAALTPTDGALVGAAVASVWLAAWAWKAIYKTLDDTGDRE